MKETAKTSTQNRMEELNSLQAQKSDELKQKNRELEIEAAFHKPW